MGDSKQGTIGTLKQSKVLPGWELQEWSLAEKGAQRQPLTSDSITMKQRKNGGKEVDI